MAEQLLDETDVGPAFQHVRGASVPERVAAALAWHARLLQPARHHARDDIGIERAAVAGEEQRLGVRVQSQTRAHFLQVTLQPVQGARAHRHDAVFLALALPDVERAPFGIQVGQVEAAKLGAADARRVK